LSIGEPARLVPEVDIILNFLALLVAFWLWRKHFAGRIVVAAFAIGLIALHYNYLRHHRAIFPAPTDHKPSIYYKIPAWIAQNHPNARSYVTGAVRFWYNTWHDLYQLGGSSEQGLENQVVMPSQWEIVLGESHERAIAWMQILGVDLVAVHGPKSAEWYKDFQYPKKFDGHLKTLYDDGSDNRIFEVPRRYRSIARIVDTRQLEALPKLIDQADLVGLQKYVQVFEGGPEAPTATQWIGTDELLVRAATGTGQSLIVQATYDINWEAVSNQGTLPIQQYAPLGFMRIDAPPGVTEIRLRFRKPFEKTVGEIIFLLTLAGMGWTLWRHRSNTSSSRPA
jgi:hypothetical protein